MCESEDIYLDYLLFESLWGDDEGEGDSGSEEKDNESKKKWN